MRYKAVWFKRKFDFNLPGELYPMVVERMRGTVIRLEDKLTNVPEEILLKSRESWTIKEQVGHLIVVEELWFKRVENYRKNEEHLYPADLDNTRTKETDFDGRDIKELLSEFRHSRDKLVREFEAFDTRDADRVSLHPRLNTPMRLIDLAYFIAEHDDHHLAKIHDIITNVKEYS